MTLNPEWVGDYNGESCVVCKRVRVILCANGKRCCEKCRWSPDLDRYVSDDERFIDDADGAGEVNQTETKERR